MLRKLTELIFKKKITNEKKGTITLVFFFSKRTMHPLSQSLSASDVSDMLQKPQTLYDLKELIIQECYARSSDCWLYRETHKSRLSSNISRSKILAMTEKKLIQYQKNEKTSSYRRTVLIHNLWQSLYWYLTVSCCFFESAKIQYLAWISRSFSRTTLRFTMIQSKTYDRWFPIRFT